MITAGTCRGTGCGFCAFSWSVVEIGGIRDITVFIKVIYIITHDASKQMVSEHLNGQLLESP